MEKTRAEQEANKAFQDLLNAKTNFMTEENAWI